MFSMHWILKITQHRFHCVIKEDRAKYIGTEENWDIAEQAIIDAAKEKGLTTVTEYGEARFMVLN